MTLIKISLVVFGSLFLGQTAVDWNKKVQETAWSWPEHVPNLFDSSMASSKPYTVRLEHINDDPFHLGLFNVSILRDDKVLVTFRTPHYTIFKLIGDKVVYTNYNNHNNGCEIVALDLVSKKEIWRTRMDAVSPIPHSVYGNCVNLDTEDNIIVVFGWEGAGKYVEYLEPNTGKVLGKKAFTGQ